MPGGCGSHRKHFCEPLLCSLSSLGCTMSILSDAVCTLPVGRLETPQVDPLSFVPLELKFFSPYGSAPIQYTFGEDRGVSADRGQPGPHVRLRANGVRLWPHRQFPDVYCCGHPAPFPTTKRVQGPSRNECY